MTSHVYQFSRAEALRLAGWPLACLVLLALALRLAAALGLLPPPRPALDIDRTILLHQAAASRARHSAEVVLAGDSSCLMGVSALQLSKALGREVLNLATLSHVGLEWHARLINAYASANPGLLKEVIVLMHPETLRLGARNPYFNDVLSHDFAQRDFCPPGSPALACWLGVPISQGRILSRVVPSPLPGTYGIYYGSSWDLWRHLTAHSGSAIDPRLFQPGQAQGSPEYRLAPQWEPPARAFKARLPPGVKLVAGITPSPESFVLRDHSAVCGEILRQWSAWLEADAVVAAPYVMPDRFFASQAHLNEQGMLEWTARLAEGLR